MWGMLASLLGPMLGGIFGGGGGASSSAESAAQAQAAMINEMMKAYQGTFGPAQKAIMEKYMGMIQGMPTQDIAMFQMLQNLMPAQMPDIIKNQMLMGARRPMERELAAQQEALARRGITGPAAEAILQRIREKGIGEEAGVGTNIGTWEAEQTLSRRGDAYKDMMNMLGLGGQYAQSVNPNAAAAGAGDMARMFGGMAQAQAKPWQNMMGSMGGAIQDWMTLPRTGTTQPMSSPGMPSTIPMWQRPGMRPGMGQVGQY